MNMCTKCVLPETFPGIRFGPDGVCNYCRESAAQRARHGEDREKYRNKFEDVLGRHRGGRGSYDVVMAYSGGKDSSYTLKILKQTYGLSVLAVTFDHGFMSPHASKNIHIVTDALNVHRLIMSPSRTVLSNAFRRSAGEEVYPLTSLIRASAICNTCMHLVKSFVLKLAVQMGIPFIAYGWSPGQAPLQSSVLRLNPSMIRTMQAAVEDTLKKIMGDGLEPFIMGPREYALLSPEIAPGGAFVHAVHPLAYGDYNEERIVEEIRTLGWRPPTDTDSNSTNCLLNVFANQHHIKHHRFHPYAHEIAGLVREGHMTREAGIAKLSVPPDKQVLEEVASRLGVE